MKYRLLLACLAALGFSLPASSEDGYDLWLRYRIVDPVEYPALRSVARELVAAPDSPTLAAAQAELSRGLSGLTGQPIAVVNAPTQPGAIVFGTPSSSPLIAGLRLDLAPAGQEGYLIRSVTLEGRPATVIAANSDAGVLYG